VANTASVLAGLTRAGATPRLGADPEEVRRAERVVLPGVGAFAAAMQALGERGLVEPLRERLRQGRPTLGICLGLQILCEASEESPGVAGLGVAPGAVGRFPGGVRVPQLGWNRVVPDCPSRFLVPGFAYFANSYRLVEPPPGWIAAFTDHGGPFVAAMEKGDVLACQFHPELSGAWGLELLRSWLQGGAARGCEPARGESAGPLARSLAARVIPCLDVRDGRVVKGVRFQGLRDAGSPTELAAAYEAQGADELVLLDVSATPEGRKTRTQTVREVREVLSIPLTVGGGVRSVADAGALLDAGADKVGVNTAAVERPAILTEIAGRFGSQCAILALDAAQRPQGGWEVVTLSGRQRTGLDAVQWAREAVESGAGEILLTSWDRDGTRLGYDLELVQAVSRAVRVPVIASGGASSPEHLLEGLLAGADAVLAASIFHYGEYNVADLKDFLAAGGVAVRR
jgi:imidazole glycerol phosphate synthase glutamine amidotransferase subunit